jgi:hypothetical protein
MARQIKPLAGRGTEGTKGTSTEDATTIHAIASGRKVSPKQKTVLEFDENGLPRQLNTDRGANPFEIPAFKTEAEASRVADKIHKQTLTQAKPTQPHVLEVTVKERGEVIGHWWEVSETGHNWSKHGDTEQKALSRMNLNSDVEVWFKGTHWPCSNEGIGCLKAIGAAIEQSGATILYDAMVYNPSLGEYGKFVSKLKEYPEYLPHD